MPIDTPLRQSFDGIVLPTKRLVLRPFRACDAPAILGLFSDQGFMEYVSTPMFRSLDEALALVARDTTKRAAGERLRLGMERSEDGAVIGYCDVFQIDRDRSQGEIGYGLRTPERGHGYMHEALSAFLPCVFHVLQLNRVTADIDPANTNSEKTVQRLGFTREGDFPQAGAGNATAADSVTYSLLRRDWQERASS